MFKFSITVHNFIGETETHTIEANSVGEALSAVEKFGQWSSLNLLTKNHTIDIENDEFVIRRVVTGIMRNWDPIPEQYA